ncbi:MAG TPA: hypothetical protein VFY61_04030 [Pyrinomonadaceae bacterium]|nr:hypothetical protein [Pyrinomonadaceae bacterium]
MKLTTLLLTFLLGATVAFAQQSAIPAAAQPGHKLSGVYEGTVKGQTEKVTLHLKVDGPKLAGRVQVGDKTYELTQGAVTEKTVSLVFKDGKLDGDVNGEMLICNLWVGSEKKVVELQRAPAVPAVPAVPATPEAKFVPNGQWEAVADANGQPFPFLLTLKVDGESVSGNSSSQLGEAPLKDGTWKDGKLAFVIEGSNGNISMVATVVDGKLSGEFDYAGQLQGKWVAVRKQ